MLAACYLVRHEKMKPLDAIETIRKYRSQRAIETREQEEFVEKFS
jgi:hypothetical protein